MTIHQTYMTLDPSFYSVVDRVPYTNITTHRWNQALAEELNLSSLREDPLGMAFLQGTSSTHPYFAQAYAGNQYGHFTMLGDGRAMIIGELEHNDALWDLQLKGSGPTPYSRRGDGKATTQSMLREYLISEAMHRLGVPSTRSLAVFDTHQMVQRDQMHHGAMLLRVASCHLRVGTFEYARSLDDIEKLRSLADYAITRHVPSMAQSKNRYLSFFEHVVEKQAKLIAKWQSLGFVHGVMNTDNMAISGETIDYGPCAFLDHYDPSISFSSIDVNARYAYFRQPYIASWNLSRLAMALLPLIEETDDQAIGTLNQALSRFEAYYNQAYRLYFGSKLGLFAPTKSDDSLIAELLELMRRHQADFTNTFVLLTRRSEESIGIPMIEWTLWKDKWIKRIHSQGKLDEAFALMKQHNPVVIPRNHLVKEAVDTADFQQDSTLFDALMTVLQHPYDYDAKIEDRFLQPDASTKRFVSYCGT